MSNRKSSSSSSGITPLAELEIVRNRRSLMELGAATAIGGAAFLASRPAAASVTDALFDKGGAVFNVKGYGALGDGLTDDTTSINSAITAATVKGGTVYFPQGTYMISSTLSLTTRGMHLVGAGRHCTVIAATDAFRNGDMIYINSTEYCSVEHLTVSGGSSAKTGGAAVHIFGPDAGVNNASAAAHWIRDLNLYNQYIGIQIDGPGWINYVDGIFVYPLAANGYGIYINTTGATGASQFISNVAVNGGTTTAANQPAAAIRVKHTGDYQLRAFTSVLCKKGLLIDPDNSSGGYGVQAGFHTDCLWDTMSEECVLISPTSTGTVRNLVFTNCWMAGGGQNGAAGNTRDGFKITGNVRNIQFHGCMSHANFGHGFLCSGDGANTQAIFFDACEALGNNRGGGGGAGFVLQNTFDFAIRNCHAGQGYGFSSQAYGVRVLSGTNNYIILGNLLRGNTTNLDAGAGANKVVDHNLAI